MKNETIGAHRQTSSFFGAFNVNPSCSVFLLEPSLNLGQQISPTHAWRIESSRFKVEDGRGGVEKSFGADGQCRDDGIRSTGLQPQNQSRSIHKKIARFRAASRMWEALDWLRG